MLTLSENSWHFWIIKQFGDFGAIDYIKDYASEGKLDICRYFRYFIVSVLRVLLQAILLCLFGYWVIYSIIYDIGMLFGWLHLAKDVPVSFVLGNGIMIIVAIVASGAWLGDKNYERRRRLREMEKDGIVIQPSFLKTVYRSFKEKTCILIDLK